MPRDEPRRLTASEVTKLYGHRFQIEETFRDTKDIHFGMGLKATHIKSAARRDRLLLLAALAHALLTLLGAAGERCGLDRRLRTNTSKRRQLSLYNQGAYWYEAIPNMREERLALLMNAYVEELREHAFLKEIFGVVWGDASGMGQLPFGVAANRDADNTFLVHVSDPSKDELLLVDAFQTTLVRQDSPEHFDTRAEALIKTSFGNDDPYGLDFRLADVDGDGRTDFVHRTKEGVAVLLGQPSGLWGPEQFSAYGAALPDTAGVRLVDLNGDGRDDLVWLERQPGPADARYVHVRLANSDKPNGKPQGKPGTFGPELVSPIEIGDGWAAKGAGAEPFGVGGYDFGDVTGDGVPDVANVGTFGSMANGVMLRVAALFVKPGRGDGTFAELRVFRLPLGALSVKDDIAAGFALLPTRQAGRADPVFIGNEVNGTLDVLVAK